MASSEWNFSVLKLWKQKRKTETHNHRNPQCRVKSSDRPKHTHVLFFPQEDFLTGAIRSTNWRHDPPLPGTPADQRRPLSLCSGGGTGRGHSSLHLLSSWPAWLAYALDDLDTRHASSEDKPVFFHSTSAREAQQFQVSSKIFTIFLFNNCPIVTLSKAHTLQLHYYAHQGLSSAKVSCTWSCCIWSPWCHPNQARLPCTAGMSQ